MKITDPKALSNYIRDKRRTRGLSQAKVGDLVGLRQGTVSKFESMPEKMQLDTLFRLLSALVLCNKVDDVIERVKNDLPDDFPTRVSNPIFEGMLERKRRLLIE